MIESKSLNSQNQSQIFKHFSKQSDKICKNRKQTTETTLQDQLNNSITLKDIQSYLKSTWNDDEEKELYKLHDEIGNKWAIIAVRMMNRTDNCVKNHFYSKLRKSLRKMNKIIYDYYKKDFKQIKINAIYKIVQANQQKHKDKKSLPRDIIQASQVLKNKLLKFAQYEENLFDNYKDDFAKKLINEVINFNRSYKKSNRKKRKNSDPIRKNNIFQFVNRKGDTIGQIQSLSEVVQEFSNAKNIQTTIKKQNIFIENKQYSMSQHKNISNYLLPSIPIPLIMKKQTIKVDDEKDQFNQLIKIDNSMMQENNMPMLFLRKDFSRISRLSGRAPSENAADLQFFEQSENNFKNSAFNIFEYQNRNDIL